MKGLLLFQNFQARLPGTHGAGHGPVRHGGGGLSQHGQRPARRKLFTAPGRRISKINRVFLIFNTFSKMNYISMKTIQS